MCVLISYLVIYSFVFYLFIYLFIYWFIYFYNIYILQIHANTIEYTPCGYTPLQSSTRLWASAVTIPPGLTSLRPPKVPWPTSAEGHGSRAARSALCGTGRQGHRLSQSGEDEGSHRFPEVMAGLKEFQTAFNLSSQIEMYMSGKEWLGQRNSNMQASGGMP